MSKRNDDPVPKGMRFLYRHATRTKADEQVKGYKDRGFVATVRVVQVLDHLMYETWYGWPNKE